MADENSADVNTAIDALEMEFTQLEDQLNLVEDKQNLIIQQDEDQTTYLKSLGKFVTHLFNQRQYSDLEILLENGHWLYGHKIILASRSDRWDVDDIFLADQLDFTDLNYDLAYATIKWVYTNEINLEIENNLVIELMKITKKFRLTSLFNRCESVLISRVHEENCKHFRLVAKNVSSKKLRDHCASMIEKIEEETSLIEKEDEDDDDYADNDDVSDRDEEDIVSQSPVKRKRKQSSKEKEKLQCSNCGARFKTNKEIDKHVLEHKGATDQFVCYLCGKSDLGNRQRLLRHVNAHDPNLATKEQEKTCNVCGESLSNAFHLRMHMKSQHPGNRPHKCQYCPKDYRKKAQLEIHVRLHTGEKPYTCEMCGKAFRDAGTLRSHVRTHDPIDVRPFVCDACGHRFISVGALNTHAKSHNKELRKLQHKKKYMCNICGRTFAYGPYLKTHELIHAGEKPHQCEHCERKFSDKTSLRRHLKIHTGEKPHTCQICGKKFIQKVQLTKHNLMHEKHAVNSVSVVPVDDSTIALETDDKNTQLIYISNLSNLSDFKVITGL